MDLHEKGRPMKIGNEKFQNSLKQIPQSTPPIWFMRQAGRYHHHYQNLRKQHSFDELCKIPSLASEVALGPILDFDYDVAILFSDILYPLEALGFGLNYTEQGPRLGFHLNDETKQKLRPLNEAHEFLKFQAEAVSQTRAKLPKDKSLIGFVGGLWTLFVYACEGGHAGSLIETKKSLRHWPHFSELMFNLHSETIRSQLAAGAEVVNIFDTAAGEVSPLFFKKWIAPDLKRLALLFPHKIGYYSKGTQSSFFDSEWLSLPWAGMGYDHRWNLPKTLSENSHSGFFQGNFDQSLLHSTPAEFREHLKMYLNEFAELDNESLKGWVSGLGHGVLPKTPEANVHLFIEEVRKWGAQR